MSFSSYWMAIRQRFVALGVLSRHRPDAGRMRAQEQWWALLLESLSEGAILTDSENRILSVNPAFSHFFGYLPEEAQGRDFDFLMESGQEEGQYPDILELPGVWRGEVICRCKDGERRKARLCLADVRDSAAVLTHRVMLLSITDARGRDEGQPDPEKTPVPCDSVFWRGRVTTGAGMVCGQGCGFSAYAVLTDFPQWPEYPHLPEEEASSRAGSSVEEEALPVAGAEDLFPPASLVAEVERFLPPDMGDDLPVLERSGISAVLGDASDMGLILASVSPQLIEDSRDVAMLLSEEDLDALERLTHRMSGYLSLIAARQSLHLCRLLEKALNARDVLAVRELAAPFNRALLALTAEIGEEGADGP